MKLIKIYNYLYLYQFIYKDNNSILTICIYCFNLLILYIKIKNHSKCAECICCNYLYINVL